MLCCVLSSQVFITFQNLELQLPRGVTAALKVA
jgi:hypothetical protein